MGRGGRKGGRKAEATELDVIGSPAPAPAESLPDSQNLIFLIII